MLDLGHIVLMTVSTVLFITLQLERHRAIKREEKLVEAVLADNLPEYQNSPEARIKEAKTESKLAEKAYKLQQLDRELEPPHFPIN